MLSSRLLGILVATASVLVTPTPVHAARIVTEDAVSDAQSIRADADEEVFDPAPQHTAVDITRTVVAHGVRRLRVQVRYRDLERTFPRGALVKVRTPGRRYGIEAWHSNPLTRTQLTRGQIEDDVRCPGLRSSLDRARDQLTVSVPTACLGGPAWVRVGVLSIVTEAEVGSESDAPYDAYFDDAYMAGGFEDRDARLGPKVFRG